MTSVEQNLKEQFDQRLKEKNLRFLVLGYIIENNEMVYVSVACSDEVSRDRNVEKLVNAKWGEIKWNEK